MISHNQKEFVVFLHHVNDSISEAGGFHATLIVKLLISVQLTIWQRPAVWAGGLAMFENA